MNKKTKVLVKKLWGENAAELFKSAQNIIKDYKLWNKQVVVVSAIRSCDFNTTDYLIKLWQSLPKNDKVKIDLIIDKLLWFHLNIVNDKLDELNEEIKDLIKKEFILLKKNIKYFLWKKEKDIIPSSENDYSIILENNSIFSILWFWEILSCRILTLVINKNYDNIIAQDINLSNLIIPLELDKKSDREIFNLLSNKIYSIVYKQFKDNKISILSGYIWVFNKWIEKTIWRWYSDATAAIVSVWLTNYQKEIILEIHKSVEWLLSADPRILYNPKDAILIEELNYLSAREITWDSWAQAKLLHYQTLRSEIQEAWIKIHLFDPFSEDNTWTWIYDKRLWYKTKNKIEFIWGRDDIIFLSISSWKMFEKWILTKLFSIVDDYFSVDIVSTSETEITFTIDWKKDTSNKLDEMVEKIKQEFSMKENTDMEFIEYKKNRALIFCVWQDMKDHIWTIWEATTILWKNGINIEVISQWILQRAIIFWIESKDMKKAVNLLHNTFIK